MDRQEPWIHILIRCLKWLRIGKIKLWDQPVTTSWEIYTILVQGINVYYFQSQFSKLSLCMKWISVCIFLGSVSLETCHSIAFYDISEFGHSGLISVSLLCGEEMQPGFFYCCSVFQAVLPSKLSAYKRSWGKAKFIISASLLKEIQKVSWSIKAGCLLRNTNCLFLTNYILCWFTTKLDPNITGIFTTLHWSYKEALFWKKNLCWAQSTKSVTVICQL